MYGEEGVYERKKRYCKTMGFCASVPRLLSPGRDVGVVCFSMRAHVK